MSDDLDAQVIDFVQQVTARWASTLAVDRRRDARPLRVNLTGEGADALLRRKGEALDALQVIVNTAFRRDARGDRHYVVDALGFRKGKDAELRQMAQFLMEKAQDDRRAAGNRPAQSVRAPHRAPHRGRRRQRDVREHRRRVSEDRHHFAERAADEAGASDVFATDDTIVAIATPPGRGGIGVVRLSGPDALAHRDGAARLAASRSPRHATFARRRSTRDARARRSTRSSPPGLPRRIPTPARTSSRSAAHGSPVLLARIVELAIGAGRAAGRARRVHAARVPERPARSGAGRSRRRSGGRRHAAPGARGHGPARRHADRPRFARSTRRCSIWRRASRRRSTFPTKDFTSSRATKPRGELARIARRARQRCSRDGRAGRVMREGRTVVIAGRPNAGKSSLFNALARRLAGDRHRHSRHHARSAHRAGRCGRPCRHARGHGRPARGPRRDRGRRRAPRAAGAAGRGADARGRRRSASRSRDDDRALLGGRRRRADARRDQQDRSCRGVDARRTSAPARRRASTVSAITGAGTGRTAPARIAGALTARDDLRDPPAISNVRHLALVEDARDAVDARCTALADGATEELVLAELARARRALEEITGRRTADDLDTSAMICRYRSWSRARFCIGKCQIDRRSVTFRLRPLQLVLSPRSPC